MQKAQRAATSARLLLEEGDPEGACNRAYYAMFDAARAVLIADEGNPEPRSTRTHSSLIANFSLHMVKTKRVPLALGRAFNRVHEMRLVADYKGDPIEMGLAAWAVEQAEHFVQALRGELSESPTGKDG